MRIREQLVALVLAVFGLLAVGSTAAEKAESPPTIVAQRGLLRIVVRLPGIVAPAVEAPVSARAAGEITSVPVELGQVVKKGQKLLEVESSAYVRAVERARAEWLEAQAQLRIAQVRLAMAEREFKRSQSGHTTYSLELQRQEAALREAATSRTKLALDNAGADLANTSLFSPIDGVITECLVKRKEIIAPGSVESGMRVMTVSDLSRIAVIAEIEESQVRDIQPNLAANVVLNAFPERRFPGRIASISPRGQIRGNKTTFPIRIDLEGDPGEAGRIGLTANIEIAAIEKPDALLVETRAVRWAGAEPHVVLLEKGQPKQQKVRLGRSDGTHVEVLEGLREGDQVVLPAPPAPPETGKKP